MHGDISSDLQGFMGRLGRTSGPDPSDQPVPGSRGWGEMSLEDLSLEKKKFKDRPDSAGDVQVKSSLK